MNGLTQSAIVVGGPACSGSALLIAAVQVIPLTGLGRPARGLRAA